MRAVVTGAAGFIGSHLTDALLAKGHEVIGVDSFDDYYPRAIKERNLESAILDQSFRFHELDITRHDVSDVLDEADVVFHLASRSGVRASPGDEFDNQLRNNVVATQRLLESLKRHRLTRFVYASSWSVYGDAERLPTKESSVPLPLTSYGVTKLAAEHLVQLYSRSLGLPAVSLRYFTVYGPRQRPDMAIARFMQSLAVGEEIEIFGDGEQTREFTFVSDAVEATMRAATADVSGMVLNVGGGGRASINSVLTMLEEITGIRARRRYLPATPEDRRQTGASINLARWSLAWEPRISLRDGLAKQWSWLAQPPGQAPELLPAAYR
jgi:UDP-glucuronate 4-epimerase